MYKAKMIPVYLACIMFPLGGCGLVVPKPHEFYEAKSNDTDFVNVVFNNVKCELHGAIQEIVNAPGASGSPRAQMIKSWGAKAELKFTTDELESFDPGAMFKPPPPFSLGLGLAASAHSTRTEDVAATYALQNLLSERAVGACPNENGILIQSDLDIKGFLFKYVSISAIPGTLPTGKDTPFDTLTYTVNFVASFDANATPTWTFKHVTVNPSGKLFDASRTKTSNLIVTFSPIVKTATTASAQAPVRLDDQGLLAHSAAVIGQAVAVSTQSLTH
jgi:hypothetical protein